MKVSNKFDVESKKKMKKMIDLSYQDGSEYFTIIKKDYTLGEITKGIEGACFPDELLEKNKENVIGTFHTHPHPEDFFEKALKESIQGIDTIDRIMNFSEKDKEKIKQILPDSVMKTCLGMSLNDLRYTLLKGFTVECIGLRDKDGKLRVFCHELFSNAKERILQECNSLDENLKDIFKKTFLKWINGKETNEMIDMAVFLSLTQWVVKDTYEIKL